MRVPSTGQGRLDEGEGQTMATVELSAQGGRIFIRTTHHPDEFQGVLQRCQAIPGRRWDKAAKVWTAPATAATAATILNLFKSFEKRYDDTFGDLLESCLRAAAVKPDTAVVDGVQGVRTKPWRHQLQAYWFSKRLGGALLNCGMGTGKSLVVCMRVSSESDLRRILILAPKSVVAVWPREFAKHGWGSVAVSTCGKAGWTTRRKAEAMEQFLDHDGEAEHRVVVFNYEAARQGFEGREKSTGLAAALLRRQWDLVVADEAHRLQDPSSVTARMAAALRDSARCRMALTGTPMPNDPTNIFGIFRFLDPSVFGTSWTQFKARHAIYGGFENRQFLRLADPAAFAALVDSITFTAKTDDVLDLPPFVDREIPIDLSPEEMRVYRELEENFIAQVHNGEITAANALVKLLRLQQATSGHGKDTDGVVHRIGESKKDALAELLDALGRDEPLAVFATFVDDLNQVQEAADRAGRQYRELSGRRDDLKATGGVWTSGDVIAVQIQAGGLGVDLTRARHCAYTSPGFSLGNYLQSRARVRRPGQTRPVTYHHLVAVGTVDERVYSALSRKEEVVEAVIQGLT